VGIDVGQETQPGHGTRSGSPERPTTTWVRRAAWASLVVNIGIVVTGGIVRLTGSGLGCPTWPRCTDSSFTTHRAMGIHGAIEFSNRMLTFVLVVVAVATVVAAWRTGRSSLRRLAVVLLLGIPAQAVVGGISVLMDLNPWVVSAHLMISMALVGLSVVLLRRVDEGDGPPVPTVGDGVRWLSLGVLAVGWAVLYVGTVVTGSGPHAGDAHAPRNGLDPRDITQLHADLVFLLVGLTIAVLVVLRTSGAPALAHRAAAVLIAVELAQGLIGFVQYATDLPVVLVGLHLLGASLVSAALAWLVVSTRARGAEVATVPVTG